MAMSGQCVRFFFDFKSPFSYLALSQTFRLRQEFQVKVEWLPFAFNVAEGFGIPAERTPYQITKLKSVPFFVSFDPWME